MKFVIALLVSFAAFVAGAEVVRASDPASDRPYWVGTPSFLQECAGSLVTLNGYGLVPARSTYTEIEYSSGGFCNNFLGRPSGWILSVATSYSGGSSCGTTNVYNSSGSATSVATANACGGGTTRVDGTSYYLNSAAGNPSRSLSAP